MCRSTPFISTCVFLLPSRWQEGGQLKQEGHHLRQLFARVDILWCALVCAAFSLYCWASVCLEPETSREISMFKRRGGALHENLMGARHINRQGLYSSLEKHCINPLNKIPSLLQDGHFGFISWFTAALLSARSNCITHIFTLTRLLAP